MFDFNINDKKQMIRRNSSLRKADLNFMSNNAIVKMKTLDGSGILKDDHADRCMGGDGHCDSSIDLADEDVNIKK